MANMNAQQREVFRLAILGVVNANRTRFGLSSEAIGLHLGMFGFAHSSDDDRLDALDYLQGKAMVEEVTRPVSAENRAWRITTTGIAYLDSH